MERKDFDGKAHEEVANYMATKMVNSQEDQAARAEFLLRQTNFMERQALATEKYTKYMFWSVVVLAASSLITLLIQIFKWC
jgi:hypothetical protein